MHVAVKHALWEGAGSAGGVVARRNMEKHTGDICAVALPPRLRLIALLKRWCAHSLMPLYLVFASFAFYCVLLLTSYSLLYRVMSKKKEKRGNAGGAGGMGGV